MCVVCVRVYAYVQAPARSPRQSIAQRPSAGVASKQLSATPTDGNTARETGTELAGNQGPHYQRNSQGNAPHYRKQDGTTKETGTALTEKRGPR